jgi:hypothetical protein
MIIHSKLERRIVGRTIKALLVGTNSIKYNCDNKTEIDNGTYLEIEHFIQHEGGDARQADKSGN